jgi:oxygen-dependent protoporphyrinogen oxidase
MLRDGPAGLWPEVQAVARGRIGSVEPERKEVQMRIAVVGAGPAGLTAAHRLTGAGHEVVVLEKRDLAGGRTHTEHFGPGHYTDTGAGWLGSFYPDTLALLGDLGERGRLQVLSLRGGGDLSLDGRVAPNPNSMARILRTGLLSPMEKVRFAAFMAGLLLRQPGALRVVDRWDAVPAVQALRPAGRRALEVIVRPSFEGPFFSRLEEMSGSLVRSWLRALSIGTFYRVEGGMDAPWRVLAARLDVRTGVTVERVATSGGATDAVEIFARGREPERFDGAVVAVPAPVAATLVGEHPAAATLRGIRYAPHVRLYAARHGDGPPRTGIHALPNANVATVELSTGRDGAWGRAPDDWQWQLICAPAATSGRLLELPDAELRTLLWTEAARIDPRIFPLDAAEVSLVVRWRHAVPIVGPGYFGRIRALAQRPPIAFAGDWLVQPCVEGAVRSGIRAAAVFGAT